MLVNVVRLRDEANALAASLLPGQSLFETVSVPLPQSDRSFELAFIRCVSWLFAHYHEAGAPGVRFLAKRARDSASASEHLAVISDLRTYFHHNLYLWREHDVAVRERCGQWFFRSCGTRVPSDEKHWFACLLALLSDTLVFLKLLLATAREIENDPDRSELVAAWRFQIDRFHAPAEFDPVIAQAASDFGRDYLDVVAFRNAHVERWRNELSLLQGDYDFSNQARRLIEADMLRDTRHRLPITGADILLTFSLEAGPQIGRLLECADQIYRRQPCGKDELLALVAQECMDRPHADDAVLE